MAQKRQTPTKHKVAPKTKLTHEQIQTMLVLWLTMSGNVPAGAQDDPVANWDALIEDYVDIPGAKDSFTRIYKNRKLELQLGSKVFRELYNALYDGDWNGTGTCFFSLPDIVSMFPSAPKKKRAQPA